MQRKVLIGLGVILLAVVFIGFGFTKNVEVQKEYEQAMERGMIQTKKCEYQAAKISFQNAAKRKQDDPQAERNIKQLDLYMKAKTALNQRNYDRAKKIFDQAADANHGLNVLVRRSSAYATEIEEAQNQLASFERLYDEAIECNEEGNYAKSNTLLTSILKYRGIKERYYDSIYAKAKHLKHENDQFLAPAYPLKSEHK